MAKIFRFSGYMVNPGDDLTKEIIEQNIEYTGDIIHQLHIDEGAPFEWDDESPLNYENCDLAHLEAHFIKQDNAARQEGRGLVLGGIYRHFKEGKEVKVITTARNTETLQTEVIYICDNGNTYARPLAMFLSKVDSAKYPDAKQEYRFELVGKEG